jgi:RHS repeat-associated protein
MDLDVNGNVIARYVQNPNVLDEPISIRTSIGTYYYLFDGLGSVTGLTDTGGNLVAAYSYDAFGNILSETGDATLNAINPYRYTSRVYDKESGLYYYRARYYDANVGRFISPDPLRDCLVNGENLYVYCKNNPVMGVDPLGLCGWFWYPCLKWSKTRYINALKSKFANYAYNVLICIIGVFVCEWVVLALAGAGASVALGPAAVAGAISIIYVGITAAIIAICSVTLGYTHVLDAFYAWLSGFYWTWCKC